MPFYNNEAFGRSVDNLLKLFQPPSGQEMAGWAAANERNAKAKRDQEAYERMTAPGATPTIVDQFGIASGAYTPTQSYHAVDVASGDRRYDTDVTARTSLATNAADNARAIREREIQEASALQRQFAEPIKLNQGETAILPKQTVEATGLDPRLAGAPKPQSETEWRAGQGERLRQSGQLTDQDLRDIIVGDRTPVQAIGPDGKPTFMSPGQAVRVGAQPAPRTPETVVNMGPNGVPYGDPEKGTVWARNPDGSVKLDERGAPIAIPYQGGSVYKADQAAAVAASNRDQRDDAKTNIVVQDIDRALAKVAANPNLTTGPGAQLTGGIGGSPAYDLNAILDTVRANVGFDQLQAMRDASPTGGALGQVTERETALLQSLLGNLQPGQSSAQLTDNLNRLRNAYLDTIHGVGKGPTRARLSFENAPDPQGPSNPSQAGGGYAEGTVIENDRGERMVRRAGRWEPTQ